MSHRKRISNNLPEEEWSSILRYFKGRRNEMYKWLYESLPPGMGVMVRNGKLVLFPHPYTLQDFPGVPTRKKI